MRQFMRAAVRPLALAAVASASAALLSPGPVAACPVHTEAGLAGMVRVADNAPKPANDASKSDSVAFPNSPNNSPASADKGAPVTTDKAACSGTGPTATCKDSPKPSNAADTSDTKIATPTTVDGQRTP